MTNTNFRHAISGFTLIEVLIAMIILALGLLGLASLQGISLRNNQDAFMFDQANALIYEMSDRIKANKLGWLTIPAAPASDCATSCSSTATSCTTAQMAASDYCYWQKTAKTTLSTNATVAVTLSPKAGSATCVTLCSTTTTGTSCSLCLRITWPRTNQALSTSMNTAALELELTP